MLIAGIIIGYYTVSRVFMIWWMTYFTHEDLFHVGRNAYGGKELSWLACIVFPICGEAGLIYIFFASIFLFFGFVTKLTVKTRNEKLEKAKLADKHKYFQELLLQEQELDLDAEIIKTKLRVAQMQEKQ